MMRSKGFVVVVVSLFVLSLVAAPAAAVESSSDDIPEELEVGSDTEATFVITDLFDDFESWTLRGQTELRDVTWTVRQIDQAGNQVSQQSYDGTTFQEEIDIEDGTNRVEVRVTGTTPEIESFTYETEETFTYANFTLERTGGTSQAIGDHRTHHFTTESKDARNAIDDARETVERSGDSQAEATLNNAISAYEAGNFDNAIDLAERAESEARQTETTRSLLLFGGLGLVVLVAAVGGVYVYRSRKKPPDRLR